LFIDVVHVIAFPHSWVSLNLWAGTRWVDKMVCDIVWSIVLSGGQAERRSHEDDDAAHETSHDCHVFVARHGAKELM
jgi:hypothetical protein